MAVVQNIQYIQNKVVPAKFDRQLIADIFRAGVVRASDLAATPGGGTVVSIARGSGYIPGTQNTDQGVYRLYNDAAFNITLDAAVANPRIDRVIARMQDNTESGGVDPDLASIGVSKGAESASATLANQNGAVAEGSLPANTFIICDVIVRPSAAVASADILDRRKVALLKADVGDAKFTYAKTTPFGWKTANGAAVTRAQYPDIVSALTFSRNGGLTNTSAVVTGLSSTSDLAVGMGVTGVGIQTGTYIQSVDSGTQITLSRTATATATNSLTFYLGFGPTWTMTGNTANTSPTISNLSSTVEMYVGMPITGTGIPAGTTVASIVSGTSITISNNATATNTGTTLTFRPIGSGDGTTTINLPDMRSRNPIGAGQYPGMANYVHGNSAGEENHLLTGNESGVQDHTHNGVLFVVDSQSGGTTNDGRVVGGGVNAAGVSQAGTIGHVSGAPISAAAAHNNVGPARALTPLVYTGAAS